MKRGLALAALAPLLIAPGAGSQALVFDGRQKRDAAGVQVFLQDADRPAVDENGFGQNHVVALSLFAGHS